MLTVATRQTQLVPLSHAQVDSNFQNLKTAVEAAQSDLNSALDRLPLDLSLGGPLTAVPGRDAVPSLTTSNEMLGGLLNWQAQALLNRVELLNILYFGAVSLSDPKFAGGAKGDGVKNDTAAIKAALNSGAKYIPGAGKNYLIDDTLVIPGGVNFDGQGGELQTADGTGTKSVILTGGPDATIQNWGIRSNESGIRKGYHGVYVDQKNTTLRNLRIRDVTYSAIFNDAEDANGEYIRAENCGWDLLSNYSHSKNSTFRNLVGVRNGRSMVSTDPGADGIMVDGFLSIDNGLDEVVGTAGPQHKDNLHYELAKNCTIQNGRVIYTSAYDQGKTSETYAILRCNASTNCVFRNIDILVQSTANGRLLLGVVDTTNGIGNKNCGAYDINVDSTGVPDYQLMFWNFDGQARYDLTGQVWRGFQGIRAQVAGGLAFSSIRISKAEGPGPGQFIASDYNTSAWDISDFHISGYSVAFNLAGFRESKIRNGRVTNAYNNVFFLPTIDDQSINQPNGGSISDVILDGSIGYILQTRNQVDRPLLVTGLTVDANAAVGLDCSGSVGTATAKVKAIGNLVGGTIAIVQQNGTNSTGALSANLNNVAN